MTRYAEYFIYLSNYIVWQFSKFSCSSIKIYLKKKHKINIIALDELTHCHGIRNKTVNSKEDHIHLGQLMHPKHKMSTSNIIEVGHYP